MPHLHSDYDPALFVRVCGDIRRYRRRRAVFALLSLLIIVTELALSAATLVASLRAPYATASIAFAALSTFLITADAALGIRERASSSHAALNHLLGMRDQMCHPLTAALWQEYGHVRAHAKINYLEAVCDACACSVREEREGCPAAASVIVEVPHAATHR